MARNVFSFKYFFERLALWILNPESEFCVQVVVVFDHVVRELFPNEMIRDRVFH